MPSLLDRTRGYAAHAVRRALGRSPDARVEALEKRVRELERALTQQLRLFNGLSLNNHGNLVGLDHRQRIHLRSRDGSIVLSKVDGFPYAVDFSVDPEALDLPFCETAVAGVVDCEGETDDVAGCGGRIEFHAGDYVAAKLAAPDDPDNVAVELLWCAPSTDSRPPTNLEGRWDYGVPDGWLLLSMGSACAGGCTSVLVPFWNVPGNTP